MKPVLPDQIETLRLEPSRPRLWIGTLALAGVAALILWISFTGDFPPAARFVLFVWGAAMAAGAFHFVKSGDVVLEFDGMTLAEADGGRVLAQLDNVRRVERGALAFKPSSGFLIVLLTRSGKNVWVPGVWWRVGRHVGVGGVVPSHAARFMAEAMELRLAAHQHDTDASG